MANSLILSLTTVLTSSRFTFAFFRITCPTQRARQAGILHCVHLYASCQHRDKRCCILSASHYVSATALVSHNLCAGLRAIKASAALHIS